ncbi:MAG: response regulator transcription factor [Labilithrix sp.]|nr:response regulator transcription factor [Labilithrix sp.]MCW5813004.1 response regulator transcription factor [Labilithrix sp.]
MPRRILLIDDSALVLDFTRAVLERAGYEVATATTVAAFEAERRRAAPDLIIVDVQMPEVFGDDLASALRGAYKVSSPILLLSSLDEEELARRAAEAEVDGWVTKKAGPDALLAKVKSVLGEA